ncbi:MAG: SpvB/TcaC N-terminal domain-containing protein, partial [Micromonosporaceae bacterium]
MTMPWPASGRGEPRQADGGGSVAGVTTTPTSRPTTGAATGSGPGAGATAPILNLPKGGGAIRGIGETFTANPVTGTASLKIPFATSAGRAGFGPGLGLSYDSGAGNGPFGLGMQLSVPAVTRGTRRGLPRYVDGGSDEDIFVLSEAEDLVPVLTERDGRWTPVECRREVAGRDYVIRRYRPRVEGPFARIERWTECVSGEVHWRSISRDNVTSRYGATAESRIADPDDPRRVFSWLLCERYDDTGNATTLGYKAEDGVGVDVSAAHERNRAAPARTANRYLKRVRYGNRVPRGADADVDPADWLFEVVFDYGEHDPTEPSPQEQQPWLCRADPFSSYRSGFELRSYRLCQRVLMFHHFPDEPEVGRDCLVRATELRYRGDPARGEPVATMLTAVTQVGYRRRAGGGYHRAELPPLELTYSVPTVDEQVHTVDPESLHNLPSGVDGAAYRWIDLDGEGVAGVLAEQAGTWFYKVGLGGGRFGPVRPVVALPATAATPVGRPAAQAPSRTGGDARPQLLDLDGDGQLDLVQLSGPTAGSYPRVGSSWAPFVAFTDRPELDWSSPHVRLVDLTGDGLVDVLVTEDDVFTWYAGRGPRGFAPGGRTYRGPDDERGPRLVRAEPAESIYLADFSGDGLADLVRVRNGEVCYWPNLGYGRFGAKVTMDGAPWMDEPDQFDQRRVRLTDIDGSGPTDLVYLHRDGVRLYTNRSGNSFAPARVLRDGFGPPDTLAQVSTVDLLGQGTACLVWSSPLPGGAGRTVRYLDLMGGVKPHLLTAIRNNLGAETRLHYAPSTRFYLADKAAGRPWLTRLPFPVHVLERVETLDRISHNRFITRYAYHHGHYDGVEREFRGFGMVEQYDTEEYDVLRADGDATNVEAATHLPPVMNRSWFHTGVFVEAGSVSRGYAREYYPDDADLLLPDTELPTTLRRPGGDWRPWRLDADEAREAGRALKGALLRQEVYALDGSPAQGRPYTVVERSYTVELLQPRSLAGARNAVFFVHPRETITATYERMLYDGHPDPRIGHELVFAVDDFGSVLRAATIGYGRRRPDPDPALAEEDHARQHELHIVETRDSYTNAVETDTDHRAPHPARSRSWQVCGLRPTGRRFGFDELATALDAVVAEVPYAEWDRRSEAPTRRLIEHSRVLYRRDDLTGPLAEGVLQAMALPHRTYRLEFTPELPAEIYGSRVDEELLRSTGHLRDADGWWVPSGEVRYCPEDERDDELGYARRHFFRASRFIDPLGNVSSVGYDRYDLLLTHTRDAVGNVVSAGERDAAGAFTAPGNDYRVLGPRLMSDANRNRAAVAYDALGLVVGTATMGKPGEHRGDRLDGFVEDLPDDVIAAYLHAPLAEPLPLLANASTRFVYDLFAYHRTRDRAQPQPATAATIARETHVSDLAEGQPTGLVHNVSYTDGFGRIIQRKELTDVDADRGARWVGSGWAVFNNKGRPVRQYEPFFTATHAFEYDRRAGVASTFCYDPVTRVVATLHPSGTWEKQVYEPWRQEHWDANDTIRRDPREDADVGRLVAAHLAEGWPSWYRERIDGARGRPEAEAARLATAHADTPAIAWFDNLGRTFLNLAQAGPDQRFASRIRHDAEGNEREIVDALGRVVIRYSYDLLGNRLHQASMESGQRWTVSDVAGQLRYVWNRRGHRQRLLYDPAQRPVASYVAGLDPDDPDYEVLTERTEYGESEPAADEHNLRTQPVRKYDPTGVIINDGYDFKGNLLDARRQLTAGYRDVVDWSGDVPLDPTVYASGTRFDALNRAVRLHMPDGTTIVSTFTPASQLRRLEVRAPGEDEWTAFVEEIAYNARGQRVAIRFGNGVQTLYRYDPRTFRLRAIRSSRGRTRLQDLRYTHDPVGNITAMRDHARPTVFFRNRSVDPDAAYTYDALYRLTEATGREHLGGADSPTGDTPQWTAHPGDGTAMTRYVQRYDYDAVGNLLSLRHRSADPAQAGWRREYRYAEPSQLEPDRVSNRLTAAPIGSERPAVTFHYDAHGNIAAMPDLAELRWNHEDQLVATARQAVRDGVPETTYYQYDTSGQRVRKVTDGSATAGSTPARRHERVYIGGFEVYREFGVDGAVTLERTSLHILDDQRRLALVETRTQGTDDGPARLLRYQLDNHLGSATVELDGQARVISYEEYYPYGGTSHQAARSRTEAPKRYRYTGKERDRETGLYYVGLRYYAPWLARWTSCDPAGLRDGTNLYAYVRGNPIRLIDARGAESSGWTRFWGGVQMVGGGLQVAAGVLGLAAPEPTMVTKVLGTVAIVHGSDDIVTGWNQLRSGTQQRTVTEQAVTGGAKVLGASDDVAAGIGKGVNIAAGFAAPVGGGPAALPGLRAVADTTGGIHVVSTTVNVSSNTVKTIQAASAVAHAPLAVNAVAGGPGGGASGGGSSGGGEPPAGGGEPPPSSGAPGGGGTGGPGGGGTGGPGGPGGGGDPYIEVARN